MKVYSRDFSTEYARRLNGMQERRMKSSIKSIGSYWYTAWINAGQPDLSDLYSDKLSEQRLDDLNKKEEISLRVCDKIASLGGVVAVHWRAV